MFKPKAVEDDDVINAQLLFYAAAGRHSLREFFAGVDLDKGQAKVNELIEAGFDVKFNFNVEEVEFPASTHGLLISPIAKRSEGKTINIGVLVAAVPTVDAILASGEKGVSFVNDCAQKMLYAKVCNSVRPRDGQDPDGQVPFSIEDFITAKRTGDALLAFSKVAPIFVRALKKKGLKHMTSAILRDTLASKANAEQFFPKIPQATWEALLVAMASKAETEGLSPALYERWLDQRNEVAGISEVEELNLDDLDLDA